MINMDFFHKKLSSAIDDIGNAKSYRDIQKVAPILLEHLQKQSKLRKDMDGVASILDRYGQDVALAKDLAYGPARIGSLDQAKKRIVTILKDARNQCAAVEAKTRALLGAEHSRLE